MWTNRGKSLLDFDSQYEYKLQTTWPLYLPGLRNVQLEVSDGLLDSDLFSTNTNDAKKHGLSNL